ALAPDELRAAAPGTHHDLGLTDEAVRADRDALDLAPVTVVKPHLDVDDPHPRLDVQRVAVHPANGRLAGARHGATSKVQALDSAALDGSAGGPGSEPA